MGIHASTHRIDRHKIMKLLGSLAIVGSLLSQNAQGQISGEFERLEASKQVILNGSTIYSCADGYVGFYQSKDALYASVLTKGLNFQSHNKAKVNFDENEKLKTNVTRINWERTDKESSFEFVIRERNDLIEDASLFVKRNKSGDIQKVKCSLYKNPNMDPKG